jgi:hypothetical protein
MTPKDEPGPAAPHAGQKPPLPMTRVRHGVVGGLLGGMVFASLMLVNGTLVHEGMMTLPLIGRLVGNASIPVGLAVHMTNSALIGALFAAIFARFERGMIDLLHFGMLYGLAWWFVGPMTIMPLALGMEVGSLWSLANVVRTFPSLIGHLIFGAILGMTVGWFRDASLPAEAIADEPASMDAIDVAAAPEEATAPEPPAPIPAPLPGPAPVWVTAGAMAVVFLLNVLVFSYALTHGLPHAHVPEAKPAAASGPVAAAGTSPAPSEGKVP